MGKRGKRYIERKKGIEPLKKYSLEEGLDVLMESNGPKFDETVDVALNLGVDPRHADQMVRGNVSLPHGTGKGVRILVFAKGEKEKEAKDGGADYVGGDELIEKIKEGWLEFERTVSTPDMMSKVSRLGKILGPRGIMPNPKMGTVTYDIKRAITEIKKGKVEFRVDKMGNLHLIAGKVSFGKEKLRENIMSLLTAVLKAKPTSSKGTYIKKMFISTTMGPSVKIEFQPLLTK